MPRMLCPNCNTETACHIMPEKNTFKCGICETKFEVTSPDEATILLDVQKDRQSNYGQLLPHCEASEDIMNALKEVNMTKNDGHLVWPKGFEIAMMYMVTKLVRMSTDPRHVDSALDLSSYSDLWKQIIEKGELN